MSRRSSEATESDTLLASPSSGDRDYETFEIERLDRELDKPVDVKGFYRNVLRGKIWLGLLLPLALGLEVLHFLSLMNFPRPERTPLEELWYDKGHAISDIVGFSLITITTLLWFAACVKPIDIRSALEIRNYTLHRYYCAWSFTFLFITIVAHLTPYVGYVMITHKAPLEFEFSWQNPTMLNRYRAVVNILLLFFSGTTRRGPKLRFDPMQIGTGFGMTAAEKDKKLNGKAKKTNNDQEMNVIDYLNCSILDFITLSYISPIAIKSHTNGKLYQSDLPHLEYNIRTAGSDASLWKQGSIQIGENGKPIQPQITGWQLIKFLWLGIWKTAVLCLFLETAKQCFSFIQMAAMHEIIETFKAPKGTEDAYAYLMCWGLFLGQAIDVVMGTYNGVRENYLLHMPVRMTLSTLLFSKILRTTDAKAAEAHNMTDEEKESGKGRSQVMNLLTLDTGVIASLGVKVWGTTNAIISLIIGVYFLYELFGISAFVGIACIPLTSPFGWFIAQNIYRCDKTYARVRDARIGAIKELLLTVKVVKLNAWEPYFRRNIQRLRDVEVVWQRWRFTLGTLFNIQADQLPVLTILVTFAFHTKILGRPLDPAAAFVALGVFNRVKDSLGAIPGVLNAVLESKVAINRLVVYLNQPEVADMAIEEVSDKIVFDNATIGWPKGEKSDNVVELTTPFTLKNIDVTLPDNKFTLVVGPLGSGKTLFLRALLGEAVIEEGDVVAPRSKPDATPVYGRESKRAWTLESWLNDSVSYAPQQAFIRHGTIRDNITFGQPFWRARYEEALRQACLESDLELMPEGDMTEVGEHGTTLSGGQKARVNLARCIYSRAKTVYMDDILSAVDAHTAQFIFEECLSSGLLKGRTLVLVTHHVSLCLPGADYFISLRDGQIEQACPAQQAHMSELDLNELQQEEEPHEHPEVEEAIRLQHNASPKAKKFEEREEATARHIYAAESSASGRVSVNHYWMFAVACGGILYWIGLLLLLFGSKGFDVWRSVWVQQWTSDNDPDHLNYYLLWYASLSTFAVIFGAIRWIWLYGVGNVGFYNRGSRKIHSMLLDSILNAPLSFFEQTPGGRLMNIFGQDTGRMDGSVADDFGRCVMQVLSIGAALVIVCLNSPILIVIFAGLAIPFFWISGVLGQLRADLRRLTAICFTPLISLYHDTIDGVVMVRAFGSNDLANATLNTIMNQQSEAMVADWTVYNWVRCVMQSMTAIVVSACGFMLVGGNFSASQAGFILSYALEVSQGLFSLLEQFSSFEQTFVSCERINYYIQLKEQETKAGLVPPPSWPSEGAISFNNLSHRYAPDLPDVLKNISFDVGPGMRVGLVGSTGSGKSTLALTLFRAVDPSGGSITIDGIDIKELSLPALRSRLNMVVQDGSLSSGTLRDALDITGEKDDVEIYEALRRVHLISETDDGESMKENPFANLDTFVAVEGANFSQGQRQLLCLARALLKKSKILVMDEATSSVDFEMDAKITQTIKECFAGTTMIVIAHRLATIIHYDRVLVLDQGRVKEYGKPLDLISDENSAFHSLCQAQGPEEFEKLMNAAKY